MEHSKLNIKSKWAREKKRTVAVGLSLPDVKVVKQIMRKTVTSTCEERWREKRGSISITAEKEKGPRKRKKGLISKEGRVGTADPPGHLGRGTRGYAHQSERCYASADDAADAVQCDPQQVFVRGSSKDAILAWLLGNNKSIRNHTSRVNPIKSSI